jgi:hypothetical protein
VVDEHAGQLVADRTLDQRCGNAGVDAARQAQDHLVGADLLADFGDRLADVVRHVPVRLAAADFIHEAADDGFALGRVRHVGVELQRVELALIVGQRRDRARVGAAHQLEARRHVEHFVTDVIGFPRWPAPYATFCSCR